MVQQLNLFLQDPLKTIARITTDSCTGSASKVMAAFQKMPNYQPDDSYLVLPSSSLPTQEDKLRRTMIASQHLLSVRHRLLQRRSSR